jgi:AraC-like DNA-binding protein
MKQSFVQYFSVNRVGFHHSVTAAGEAQATSLRPESHHTCEILYLISGTVQYIIGGKSYNLSPSDLILLPPNTLHSVQSDLTKPYERMVLHLPPELLPKLQDLDVLSVFNSAESFAYIIPKEFTQNSQILPLFQEICETCRNESSNKYIELHLINIMLRLIEELTVMSEKIKASSNFQSTAAITNENVYASIQYIEKNLTKPLTVEMIASAINFSPSYLSHAFKKTLGISLKNYITSQKLFLAQKLLQHGYHATEVATMLGYDYYSTFYQQYVKRFGISPNELATRPTITLTDIYTNTL